jgi:DNA-nicking Smr family endonuclease
VGPKRPAASPAPPRPAPVTPTETLDTSWDRQISSGRIVPDLVIDLHGLRREAARRLLYQRVVDASERGLRVILIITGKGSQPGPAPADLMEGRPARGAIRADLPRWLGEEGLSGRIAAVRRAHPRHGGAGAAYLILKRRRG